MATLRGLENEYLEPGQQVGPYRILRRLAIGGMAEIYLALITGMEGFEKLVVLKRVLPGLLLDESFVTMFLDEARLAATLQHPNIAQVYDIGFDGGSYFFAMEFVDGRDVRHLFREARSRHERIPLPVALGIAAGVAAGLHGAHENRAPDRTPLNIVHRDVSAANVIVTFDGCVKLVDFGIAKASRRETITQAGLLKGKAAYMSPEQCRGGVIDRRSDIFSLGILLYELTTTSRLFRSDDEYEAMRKIVEGEVRRPSSIVPDYPRELEAIVLKALERDLSLRYQTAKDLHIDLTRFAHAHGLGTTEYDLAAYLRRMFPEQANESMLSIDIDLDDEDEGSTPASALASPSFQPLASPARRRATSESETVVAFRDEAATTFYPHGANQMRAGILGARWLLVALMLLTLAAGWLVGRATG